MIKDQIDTTKLGLESLQESSRKTALEVLLEERDGEYQAALSEFNDGVCAVTCMGFVRLRAAGWLRSKCSVYPGKGALEGTARH